MILLVTLHSVAISVYLFEWSKNKLAHIYSNKNESIYRFKFLEDYKKRNKHGYEASVKTCLKQYKSLILGLFNFI